MRNAGIIIIILGALATSCKMESQYKREIVLLDSLIYAIDTCIVSLDQMDTLHYTELGKKFSERTNFVQAWYKQRGDTIHRETAMIMAEYRELRKPFMKFKGEYDRVENELVFTKNQLVNLNHDLQHNLLDTNIVNRVFLEERQAAEKVIADTQSLTVSNMVSKRKLAVIEPKIDSLITVLKGS
jgi:hypothetical protein